jgi:hypothetical protein
MFFEGKENDYMHIGDIGEIIKDTGVLDNKSIGSKQ